MPDVQLHAEQRSVLGKKVAQLRRRGLTPANIFGHNLDSLAIQVATPELAQVLRRAGGTRLLQLEFGGAAPPRMVLIRHISRKPTTDQILHVDFYQVSMSEKTSVEVALVLVGSAPAVEAGDGIVYQRIASLNVECLPGDIPEHIELDVSGLTDQHSAIHVSDLQLPPNVTTTADPAEVLVTITSTSAAEAEEAPAAEEAEGQENP